MSPLLLLLPLIISKKYFVDIVLYDIGFKGGQLVVTHNVVFAGGAGDYSGDAKLLVVEFKFYRDACYCIGGGPGLQGHHR